MLKKKKVIFTIIYIMLYVLLIPTTKATTITVNDETTLKNALTNVQDGTTVNLTKDIKVTSKIQITGKGSITINGNSYTVSAEHNSTDRIFEIRAEDGEENKLNITFNNMSIINSKKGSRGIDTRTDNIILTLNKITINNIGEGNNQPLTIGGTDSGITTVNIKNSNLNTGNSGYAIISFVKTNLVIENSHIQGWSALYFKEGSSGSKAKIENSKLIGINNNNGTSENFGTIAFESSDVIVEIKDSLIKAVGKGNAYQSIISNSETIANSEKSQNTVIISGNSYIEINNISDMKSNGSDSFVINNNAINLILKEGISSNKNIPSNYIDKNLTLVPNGNNYIIGKLHTIKINDTVNGKININTLTPVTGQLITIETIPNKGYSLSMLKAINLATNKEIKITKEQFSMPDADVLITAKFIKKEANPQTKDNIKTFFVLATSSILGIILIKIYSKKRLSMNNNH